MDSIDGSDSPPPPPLKTPLFYETRKRKERDREREFCGGFGGWRRVKNKALTRKGLLICYAFCFVVCDFLSLFLSLYL